MKIGFLDSGLGGLTILNEAINKLKAEYIYIGDTKYAPYGIKSKDAVKKYVFANVEYLINNGCKVIVIACNTATSVCIKDLREKYLDICFIGTEPAIKPAVISNDYKKVLVVATSLTLKEEKLKNLINKLGVMSKVKLMPLDKLVRFAEYGKDINYVGAYEYIKCEFKDIDFNEFSSIVLGCTHFPLFKKEFERNIPKNVDILDSANGVVNNMINHVNRLSENEVKNNGITIILTKDNKYFLDKACNILNVDKYDVIYNVI